MSWYLQGVGESIKKRARKFQVFGHDKKSEVKDKTNTWVVTWDGIRADH